MVSRIFSLLSGNAGGAAILVFGLFAFSIQDIIIKYFSAGYSVLQIVFVRGLIALGLFLLLFRRGSARFRTTGWAVGTAIVPARLRSTCC